MDGHQGFVQSMGAVAQEIYDLTGIKRGARAFIISKDSVLPWGPWGLPKEPVGGRQVVRRLLYFYHRFLDADIHLPINVIP